MERDNMPNAALCRNGSLGTSGDGVCLPDLDTLIATNLRTRAGRTYAVYHRAYRESPEYLAKIEARRDLQRLAKVEQRARRGL